MSIRCVPNRDGTLMLLRSLHLEDRITPLEHVEHALSRLYGTVSRRNDQGTDPRYLRRGRLPQRCPVCRTHEVLCDRERLVFGRFTDCVGNVLEARVDLVATPRTGPHVKQISKRVQVCRNTEDLQR